MGELCDPSLEGFVITFMIIFSHGSHAPPVQRQMSADYSSGRSWENYGGGGGGRRSSGRSDYGGRKSEDYGYSVMTPEEWSKPQPPNERVER